MVCCPLCGVRPARRWTRKGDWTIVRCSGCNLLITWPRPDAQTLARIYADEGYYDARNMGSAAAAAWAERARGILDNLGFLPRSVLDFGAGAGHFVFALREMGIIADGIEASPSGRAAARRLHGVELRAGMSDDCRDRFH